MNIGRLIVGLVLISIGISSFTDFDIFRYLIPALFIFFGIRILVGKSWGSGKSRPSMLAQDDINEVAVFSASKKNVSTTGFTGGKAASIFSGMDLDMTRAKIKGKRADMELVAVLGAIKVIVPKDWQVETEGAGILGGFINHTGGGSVSSPKLYVKGAAILGAVEIVN